MNMETKAKLKALLILLMCCMLLMPQFGLQQMSYAASDEDTEVQEDVPSEMTIDPYRLVSFPELLANGRLVIPESMSGVEITEPADSGGILLSGSTDALTSARIVIDNDFDFDAAPVGRVSFDGLKDRTTGMKVRAEVYLDDEEAPVAAVDLKKQMGKIGWVKAGEQSVDLIGSEITGKHRVSIGISISGKVPDKTDILLRSVEFCVTEIPVMYFHIDESEGTIEAMNSSADHSVECYGNVDLKVPESFSSDTTFRDEYDQQGSMTGIELEYIRGRGNSTWGMDKNPYKVKFDKKQNLFGFGKNKNWVLLANRYDNSLVRNRMTYWLGQQLGMEYTPQCVPVEVVMNGTYYGSYLLCEQIRIGEGRIEIDDLDDVDGPLLTDSFIKTGGYLLSMAYGDDEEDKKAFMTDEYMQFYIESPDENILKYYIENEGDEAQRLFYNFITDFVKKVENAIMGKSSGTVDYKDLMDMDAAVDYWWVQEFSQNADAYNTGSTYLYKKRDSADKQEKLYWGPLWDFDYAAWGDLMYDEEPSGSLHTTGTAWVYRLLLDSDFVERVRARWSADWPGDTRNGKHLRDLLEEITREGGLLDKYEKQLAMSYCYDHEKYGPFESEITEYSGEIDQLREWIKARSAAVDKSVSKLNDDLHIVTFVVNGEVVYEETVMDGDYLTKIPDAPDKDGYYFNGWADKKGKIYDYECEIKTDLELTPQYIKDSDIAEPTGLYFKYYEDCYSIYLEDIDEDEAIYSQKYKLMPEDAYGSEIKWSSSDEEIATVNEDGSVNLRNYGDVVITGKLNNGIRNSYKLHILPEDADYNTMEYVRLNRSSLKLKTGAYDQIRVSCGPQPCYNSDALWISLNEKIASVDDLGIVTGRKPGSTTIAMAAWSSDNGCYIIRTCKVTVTPKKGDKVKDSGSTYKVTSAKSGARKVSLIKAANTKTVTVPASITIAGQKYSVTGIGKSAFSSSAATNVIVRTKQLTKSSVRNSLLKSKVRTIKVNIGSTAVNRTYVKKYKQIFTLKNAGKKVTVN